MPIAWLNGNFIDEDEAHISIRDTGLLHAAGLFTTMRSYGSAVFRLSEHLQRLRRSCEALFVPLQHKDSALIDAVAQVLARNNLTDARLRLTVTRGNARQDPIHGLVLEPTALITAAALEPYPQEFYRRGMTVIVLDEQKLNPYDIQAGHKTLNYFSRLSALKAANTRRAGEALWFNVHNYLQSGSITNVFIVERSSLVTPPTPEDLRDKSIADACPYPRSSVLPGITRGTILDVAQAEQFPVKLEAIDVNRLLGADEVFLTNSIMGVMPVTRIENHTVGSDGPGDVTRQLMDAYAAEVERGPKA